jgi:hypothetical protein
VRIPDADDAFPRPLYFGTQRRWKLSAVIAYERKLAGLPPHENFDPADERWLTAAQMRERYGGVSDMWLWRRTRSAHKARAPPVTAE